MNIKTNYTEEREMEVQIPFFRKDNSICLKLLAVINEETVCTIFDGSGRTAVVVDTVKSNERAVVEAYKEWQPISEQDFLSYHAASLKSLSLTPDLVDDLKEVAVFSNDITMDNEMEEDKGRASL